jgi:hypothetical protein
VERRTHSLPNPEFRTEVVGENKYPSWAVKKADELIEKYLIGPDDQEPSVKESLVISILENVEILKNAKPTDPNEPLISGTSDVVDF